MAKKGHSSLECVMKCQRRECGVLKNATEIVFGLDEENREVARDLSRSKTALCAEIGDLKEEVNRTRETHDKMETALGELLKYRAFLDDLSGHEDFQRLFPTPGKGEPGHVPVSKTEKTGKASITHVIEITPPEYEEVPFYTKSRIKLEEVNDFIDSINSTLTKKYNILWNPHPVKYEERQLQFHFKQQQYSCPGVSFFTEEDMKKFGFLRNTIQFCKLINILRAAHRLREQRSAGLVRYIVVAEP